MQRGKCTACTRVTNGMLCHKCNKFFCLYDYMRHDDSEVRQGQEDNSLSLNVSESFLYEVNF